MREQWKYNGAKIVFATSHAGTAGKPHVIN